MPTSTPPAGEAHRLYLDQLTFYLRQSTQILDAWDSYSDAHTGLDGWPYDDDAYGRRQNQRDSDTLAAFGHVYRHADELVELAERQLARLPSSKLTRRYGWQLGELRTSAERLYAIHDAWIALRGELPDNAVPGTEAYDGPLAESYAEAWHYLDRWTTHGQVLIEINTLAHKENRNDSPVPAKARPVPDTATKPQVVRR